jgi:hypothetical protein
MTVTFDEQVPQIDNGRNSDVLVLPQRETRKTDSSSHDEAEDLLARVDAPPAVFGTETAVLVVVRVAVALLGTCATSCEAGLDEARRDGRLELGLTAEQ